MTAALLAIWLTPGPQIVKLPPAKVNAAAPVEAAVRDADSWSDTVLSRPLFVAGRQPPRQNKSGPVTSSGNLPRLSGVIISARGKRAIFTPDGGGKPITLGEGGALEDQVIRQILPGRVLLSGPKGDSEMRISLDHNRPAVAPTTPQITPAGQPFQNLPQFPNPGFPGGFPNPNFRPFQTPSPNGTPAPPAGDGQPPGETTDDPQPAPPPPAERSD